MSRALDCQVYYNSHEQDAAGRRRDRSSAADPGAAHRLLQLGVSPRLDLPAVLLAEPGGKLRILGLRLTLRRGGAACAAEGHPRRRA